MCHTARRQRARPGPWAEHSQRPGSRSEPAPWIHGSRAESRSKSREPRTLPARFSAHAVAVVVTPVAIGLAQALEVDARTLVVAVMAAASASFATPIGYQTNMMVYGPVGGGKSSQTS